MLRAWTDLAWYLSFGAVGTHETQPDAPTTLGEWALYETTMKVYLGVFVLGTTPLLLAGIAAPYGRFAVSKYWGPTVPAWLGWLLMEAPSPLLFWTSALYSLATGAASGITGGIVRPFILLALWSSHYVNRAFIFPFRMKYPGGKVVNAASASGKDMPVFVVLCSVFFNIMNGFINGRSAFGFSPTYSTETSNVQFFIGIFLFFFGYYINYQSDEIVRNLRKPGEGGYKIPQGGFYNYVSNANYFGEIVEWLGYAVASNSPAGAAFFITTCANLVPRAISNHQWYQEKFREKYPKNRKIVIPFIF